ncbi:MAG TPA: DUF3108 domain-containing protein [Paucimonas sp.]|nr:DUF3108 domain-containing protein [Paucimonas sp.]
MASSPPSSGPVFPAPSLRRRAVLAIATLLLHVLAFEWASGNLHAPPWQQPAERLFVTVLAPAPTASASGRARPAAKETARPKRAARPALRRSAPPAPPIDVQDIATLPLDPLAAPLAAVEPRALLPVADLAPPAAAPLADAADTPAAPEQYRIDPPPPVELRYDVQKVTRDGNAVYGSGKIAWRTDGGSYVIDGEAGVLFITALTFKSEGVLDEYGIAPVLYSEKRFRRPETNTHFHRERNTISFSASTRDYPRRGGEQDRASIVWQLAGIGRGDDARFVPDAELDIFVAGVRDGEIWRIRVIGQEEIEAGGVKTLAWHVVRTPRPGSYDTKLDIWLAPQMEWYPVKLRYTESNGDYLDMSLSNLKALASR